LSHYFVVRADDDESQSRHVWHLSVKGERPVPAGGELTGGQLLTPADPVESPARDAAGLGARL
jgi:hypothetical protein